jgi:hypothetical protein
MPNTPTEGNDVLDGTSNGDFISGLGGNDEIRGFGGVDFLDGNNGNDDIIGGEGNDWLDGGADNDTLTGGAGNDNLTGGLGNDTFLVSGSSDGFDSYFGTSTDFSTLDTIRATSANTFIGIKFLAANSGIDRIESGGFSNVYIQMTSGGQGFSSVLYLTGVTLVGITAIRGDGGNNGAEGSNSNDRFEGRGGVDFFDAGLGDDVMAFGGSDNGRAVTLPPSFIQF